MKTKYIIILFLFFFSDVNADQYDLQLNDLFGQLQNYENQNEYDKIIKKIWNIWLKPEDIRIQEDFNKALFLIDKFQYNKSIIFLSNIIDKNPNFAESWNKRATVYYLIGDYENSIKDINQTLILEPRHFGAMDGLALIHIKLKEYKKAAKIYKKILEILPYSEDIRIKIKLLDDLHSLDV